jgi:RHS repeat-associated protein
MNQNISHHLTRILNRHLGTGSLFVLAALLLWANQSLAFTAHIAGNPNPNTGDYTVTWDSNPQILFHLQENVGGTSSWTTVTSNYTGSYALSGKSPGNYMYRVKYTNRYCYWVNGRRQCTTTTTYSETTTVTVQAPPAVPGGFTAPSSDTDGSFTVSWSTVSGASTYELQRRLNFGSWSTIQNTSSTSRSESGLSNGDYGYRVRACNSLGCGNFSAVKTVSVLHRPGVPGGFTVPGSDTNGSYTVSWNSVATATSYTLQRRLNGGSWSTIQSSSATSRSESGLGNGDYGYRVQACNASGCGSYTSVKTVSVLLPPGVPGGFTAPASDTNGSYTVSWNSVSTATSYTLQRRLNGGSWSTIQNSSATSRSESSLSDGDYDYHVRACNSSGCSSYSSVRSVTVLHPPGVPGGFTAPASDTNGSYTVSWNSVSTATSYTLQRRLNGGSWSTIQSSPATSRSESGLSGGNYGYRVRACKSSVCSGYATTMTVSVVLPPSMSAYDQSDFPDAVVINPSGVIGDQDVGALSGSGGVSGGQASYSIPIVVPPGRKGMQPDISLNYSSSSGNGLLGVGWGLSATSSISRCSATAAQDGFTSGVQYDAQRDRLCLDGRRLMVVGGVYGSSGAEYRTELDIFARIKQYGAMNNSNTYFTVEYKNGQTSRYGYDAGAKRDPAGPSAILEWLVDETQDPSGNTITYDYVEHGSGEVLVSQINYTGKHGSDGDRHVAFSYEPRPDIRSSYLAGGVSRSTQRLQKITTKYQSTVVREYNLTYGGTSLSTGRSLLRSVEECGYQSATPFCFPATEFEWLESAPDYVTEELQFTDPNNVVSGSGPVFPHADKRWLHNVLPQGDVNGDGVKDWPGYYVNAEGQITGAHGNPLANCFQVFNSVYLKCIQGDFNLDGLTDSFRQNNNNFEVRMAGGTSWINTGIDWSPAGGANGLDDVPLGFGDFNGDGWLDVAFAHARTVRVYFHTTNLASPYLTSSYQDIVTLTANDNNGRGQEAQIYGDMDGNGTPDFVLSRYQISNEAPGLPEPQSIILTKALAGGGMSTSVRAIPAAGLLIEPESNSHFFHDVNGDGLPDLLGVDSTQSWTVKYRLNTGLDFDPIWRDLGFTLPMRLGQYYISAVSEWVNYRMPIMSKILAMDYDSDGREDLLYAGSVMASGCAFVASAGSNGDWLCDNNLYGEYQSSQMSHVGSAINGAVADNSVRRYNVVTFAEDAAGNITSTTTTSDIVASAAQTAVVDATGDGLPDVVTVLGCRTTSGCEFNTETAGRAGAVQNGFYTAGAWINRNPGTATDIPGDEFEYAPNDMMSAAEDAFGNRDEWTYRPLSSDAYDTSTGVFYDTVHSYQATDPEYFHFASSMYVVADHRASDGIGGLNSAKYRYRGAIYNTRGRGFQGFRSIIVEEDLYADAHSLGDTDKVTRTDFHQKWPTSSIVEQSCTYLATDPVADDNASCLDPISSVVTDLIHESTTAGGAVFVAVKQQTAKQFDLQGRFSSTTPVTDKVTYRDFDAAGNVSYESQTLTDDWGQNFTETSNSFSPNWSTWWLDKLDSRTVTYNPVAARSALSPTIAAGTDNIKAQTTAISTYDATHRLPTSVTTSGNDTPVTKTVATVYNADGLPTSVTITGTGLAVGESRLVTTTYSDNGTTQVTSGGYFPFTVTNALGHVSEQHSDPKYGVPTKQWDVNNLLTQTNYDAFGRVLNVTGRGQPTVHHQYYRCDGSPWCPGYGKYRMGFLSAGTPTTYSYHDSLGREVLRQVRNFGSTDWIQVQTEYNKRGYIERESVPFDQSKGDLWAGAVYGENYDALGRLTRKDVDGDDGHVLVTSYLYSGLTTTINAGNLPPMTRTYNGLGQLVETMDANNGFTRYAYDGAANPIAIQDPNGSTITASYNALGQKNWVSDPNMGLRDFAYNAVGEVLSELDGNGDEVESRYDRLGRLKERLVNGTSVGRWYFDNPSGNKGLGLLDFEDSQFQSDGSRLIKYYFYSDGTNGRKDLQQVTHRFFEGNSVVSATDYETQYFTDTFYARPKGMRYPGGTKLAYTYDSAGYRTHEQDPESGFVYREITNRNARNQTLNANLANSAMTLASTYNTPTGQMKSHDVSNGSAIVDLYYNYDLYGNLDDASTTAGAVTSTEDFTYDVLHRLTMSYRSTPGGSPTITYSYDNAGNITSKSDYATTYNYLGGGPNAVSSVSLVGGGSVTFGYDGNGNMVSGHGKTMTYNAFNKPLTVTAGGNVDAFSYGADLMRFRHKVGNKTIFYLDKYMEIVNVGSTWDYRHYLGDIAILTKTGSLNDPSPGIDFVHRDRLGSVAVLTNTGGGDPRGRGFGAFGKPRDGDWSDRSPPGLGRSETERGFTDHEHLDDAQLIHMNGRAYDYRLGRFLSVDPIIQAPGNSQSLNPYSYIMNNPLAGVDPTGYAARIGGSFSYQGFIRRRSATTIAGHLRGKGVIPEQAPQRSEDNGADIQQKAPGQGGTASVDGNGGTPEDSLSQGQIARSQDVGAGDRRAPNPYEKDGRIVVTEAYIEESNHMIEFINTINEGNEVAEQLLSVCLPSCERAAQEGFRKAIQERNDEVTSMGGRGGRGGASGIEKGTYTSVGVLDLATDRVILEKKKCDAGCYKDARDLLEERSRLYNESIRRYRENLSQGSSD